MDIFCLPGIGYDSNIFIVVGKNTTVIDTGTGLFSDTVLDGIQEMIKANQIQQILLTHEHYDHVGGVLDIVNISEQTAKIFAHKKVMTKLKEGKSTFAEMLGGVMPKITVDVPLSGGEHLTIGDEVFEVLYTPGHSNGSLCFFNKKSKALFSGDTVFANGGFGRYDFPGGDFKSLLNSIHSLSVLDIKSLYPGHGPVIEHNGKDHVAQALFNIRSLI